MQVTVSARHTDISPTLRAVVVEKIGRLDRFVSGMDRAEVHFEEQHNPRIAEREICEVVMEGHGQTVRCRVSGIDGFAALDRAVDTLERQLHRLKTRILDRRHGVLPHAASPPADGEVSYAVAD